MKTIELLEESIAKRDVQSQTMRATTQRRLVHALSCTKVLPGIEIHVHVDHFRVVEENVHATGLIPSEQVPQGPWDDVALKRLADAHLQEQLREGPVYATQ